MLYIIFSFILVVPVLSGWGKFSERIFGYLFTGISWKIFSGILTISVLWTVISFITPLNIFVEIPTILVGCYYFFKDKLYQQISLVFKKNHLLFVIILVILYCGSFYPYMIDHFGYYVPTIKWLNEFGLVKGVSNLNLTLGQMSIWHIFQAGFANFLDPFLRINSILLMVYALYIFEKKKWIHLCFLPFLLLFSQSPSPDLPVIIFSLVILDEIVKSNDKTALLFHFSTFVFAIKPTMIWLPLLSFLYSVFIVKSHCKSLIPGIAIILLFFLKNIYTFGYPIFPVSFGDVGVYWTPKVEVMKISSQVAIQKTFDMKYSYAEIQQFSWSDYVKNWLFLPGIKSKINILFVFSLLAFIIFTIQQKSKIINLICISILLKSVLVILFSAQYRFFIDVFFVIFFVISINYFDKKRSMILFLLLSVFFVGFISFPLLVKKYFKSFYLGNFMTEWNAKQFYKPSVYKATDFNTHRIGNLYFNVSKEYPLNYKTPLPAISEGYVFEYINVSVFPQLIDKQNISKGFISKKLNPNEKKEARKVIEEITNSYKKK